MSEKIEKREMYNYCSQEFNDFLDETSKTVKEWPDWKKEFSTQILTGNYN